MKFNVLTRYAISALGYLAAVPPGRVTSCDEIAEALGLPRAFLAKALGLLEKARLVDSLRGPQGGFRLGRPAQEISLLDVVEAADGPIGGRVDPCGDSANAKAIDCRLQAVLDRAAEEYRGQFRRVRISDLPTEGEREPAPKKRTRTKK